jgi:hypothetical protein
MEMGGYCRVCILSRSYGLMGITLLLYGLLLLTLEPLSRLALLRPNLLLLTKLDSALTP